MLPDARGRRRAQRRPCSMTILSMRSLLGAPHPIGPKGLPALADRPLTAITDSSAFACAKARFWEMTR